jgi:hypothetical protein
MYPDTRHLLPESENVSGVSAAPQPKQAALQD